MPWVRRWGSGDDVWEEPGGASASAGMGAPSGSELERSVENLRGIVADLVRQVELLRNDQGALKTAFNGHRHTLSITATATTTGTDSVGGNITATTTVSATGTAGTPR